MSDVQFVLSGEQREEISKAAAANQLEVTLPSSTRTARGGNASLTPLSFLPGAVRETRHVLRKTGWTR